MRKIMLLTVLAATVVAIPAWAAPFTGKGEETCIGWASAPHATMDNQRIGFRMQVKDGKVVYLWGTMGYYAMNDPGTAAFKMDQSNQIYPYTKYVGVSSPQTDSQILPSGEIIFITFGGVTWHFLSNSYDVQAVGANAAYPAWTGKVTCGPDLPTAAAAFKALGPN